MRWYSTLLIVYRQSLSPPEGTLPTSEVFANIRPLHHSRCKPMESLGNMIDVRCRCAFTRVLAEMRTRCCDCQRRTRHVFAPLAPRRLCQECESSNPARYRLITSTQVRNLCFLWVLRSALCRFTPFQLAACNNIVSS